MEPRIDLKIAHLLGGQPEFDSAIGADQRRLDEAGRIFHGHPQKPLLDWALADLAALFVHGCSSVIAQDIASINNLYANQGLFSTPFMIRLIVAVAPC